MVVGTRYCLAAAMKALLVAALAAAASCCTTLAAAQHEATTPAPTNKTIWSAPYRGVSCGLNGKSKVGALPIGSSLASCKAACEQHPACILINHADPPGNGACELYSGCAKPSCRDPAKSEKWWVTYQLTSRDFRHLPPCVPPAPPHPPAAKSTASWAPSLQGWTGKIKTFWFGANHTGLDSEATLALMARHDVAGYGWQTGGAEQDKSQSVGRGDAWGAAAVAHAADYMHSHGRGHNVTLFQYRQIQVALRLFAECALAADNPANAEFWLHDSVTKELCLATQPWGTSDPFWNFSNANATSFWVDRVIGQLTTDDSLTDNAPFSAVFFDEVDQGFCGYNRCMNCNFSLFDTTSLQTASNTMLKEMVSKLNDAGITPILSMDNRLEATGDTLPCAVSEDESLKTLNETTWVRFYENWPSSFWHSSGPDEYAAMIQNAILEGEAGVPNVLHANGRPCPAPSRTIVRPGPLGGELEFAVASYLIVAEPGTTLSVSNGWYDEDFCWHPEFDVLYGVPLGPARRTGPHSWTRNYTLCDVAVDVAKGKTNNDPAMGSVYLRAINQ